jgi:hypothetical protein
MPLTLGQLEDLGLQWANSRRKASEQLGWGNAFDLSTKLTNSVIRIEPHRGGSELGINGDSIMIAHAFTLACGKE